jgi:hypothetical protein
MVEIPMRCHLEFRCVNLARGEGEIGELLDEPALRRPERPDHFVIVSTEHVIDGLFDVQQVVG